MYVGFLVVWDENHRVHNIFFARDVLISAFTSLRYAISYALFVSVTPFKLLGTGVEHRLFIWQPLEGTQSVRETLRGFFIAISARISNHFPRSIRFRSLTGSVKSYLKKSVLSNAWIHRENIA